jgi:hypothetical protein
MPTVTIPRADISRDEAMQAVTQQFGSGYKVKPGHNPEVFTVEHGAMTGARVHMKPAAGATQFHVHGMGIIIGRIINELVFARKVASAISNTTLAQSS